jgi:hypothetical protein
LNSQLVVFSVAARSAGAVLALGYLLGLAPGPLVAAVGGLALITYGRVLLVDRTMSALACAALAVVAGAVGVAALRWGTLDLGELRGVQAVLGPTILVGPTSVAIASAAAAVAALLALAVWMLGPRPSGGAAVLWNLFEAGLWTLVIVMVFFDPADSGFDALGAGGILLQLARWGIALLLAVVAVLLLTRFEAKIGPRLRIATLAVGGALVVASAAVTSVAV